MKKATKGSVSHAEVPIKELRVDRQFAVEYLKAALADLDDPNNPAMGLLVLRDVAEAYGGVGLLRRRPVSAERHLSVVVPEWYPTIETLLAVLKCVGMPLSVEPGHHAPA